MCFDHRTSWIKSDDTLAVTNVLMVEMTDVDAFVPPRVNVSSGRLPNSMNAVLWRRGEKEKNGRNRYELVMQEFIHSRQS